MDTTYDVRVWKIDVYQGKTTSSYTVQWRVGPQRWKERFKTQALADSFRSDLVRAARRGEAFEIDTGRPVSARRPARDVTWYGFACDYIDMKWRPAAATYRRSISEVLTAITPAMLEPGQSQVPDAALMRHALHRWAFNTTRRSGLGCPREMVEVLRWLERHTRPIASMGERAVLRQIHEAISTRLDGKMAAASVVSKRQRVLFNVMEYAVERDVLSVNPLPTFKWQPPKASPGIDKRSVVNPVQARTLLSAVRETKRSGPRLVAFFGLMYFAGLRPEEAAVVRKHILSLPE